MAPIRSILYGPYDQQAGSLHRNSEVLARFAWHGAILAAVLLAAWHFIDCPESARASTRVHWPWIALVLGLSTVDRFLMAGKWLQLLRYVKSTATFGAVLGLRISLPRPLAHWLIRLLPERLQPAPTGIYGHYESFRTAPRVLSRHFYYRPKRAAEALG